MREDDSLVMPGLIEDLDVSSIRQSPNPSSEIIQAYELANSINQKGLLQPIIVRPKEGFFQQAYCVVNRMTMLGNNFQAKAIL
jgi:ParB-like chromosome segregation protein Spo0J